jgi:hypothetical protein
VHNTQIPFRKNKTKTEAWTLENPHQGAISKKDTRERRINRKRGRKWLHEIDEGGLMKRNDV